MNKKLINYAQNYYPDSKSDMFAMFIEKCNDFSQENGFFALITQHTWMLILSYENLRKKIINQNTILNLLHFGRGVFGSDFGTVAFVVTKKDFDLQKAKLKQMHRTRKIIKNRQHKL